MRVQRPKPLRDLWPVGVRGVDEIDLKLAEALESPDSVWPGWTPDAGPVMRIAPKPRRLTSMSPPILNEPDLRASSLALIAHLVDWR